MRQRDKQSNPKDSQLRAFGTLGSNSHNEDNFSYHSIGSKHGIKVIMKNFLQNKIFAWTLMPKLLGWALRMIVF